MIGIVIWSSSPSGDSIIWCEDQGDLAYYTPGESDALEGFHTGDVIRFDLTRICGRRQAVNPLLLEARAAAGIQALLRSRSDFIETRREARIIPFPKRREPAERAQAAAGGGALA